MPTRRLSRRIRQCIAERIIDDLSTVHCIATEQPCRLAVDHAVEQTATQFLEEVSYVQTSFQAVALTESTHALNDSRHPDNPNDALYDELHRRIPDASENRLLQFTGACHANRITASNLSTIHLDEPGMKLHFSGSSPMATPVSVDLNTPPQPRQAIQQIIQQHDQQQARMMGQIHAQNAQFNQHGPMLGSR